MKKFVAELIGTCVLVTCGCGTAMLVGCDAGLTANLVDGKVLMQSVSGVGYLLTALAFGLTIVAMAYSIGNVSGCHVNPAVSLGVLINGGMKVGEFVQYVIAQCLGALLGSGILELVFSLGGVTDRTASCGTNGLGGVHGNVVAGLVVEAVLTFIFVMAILGVTSKKGNHGSFGGLVIGLTLVLVHILGIGLTGTSVNPARSFGPAVIWAFHGEMKALQDLWVFIVGPMAGAALAALTYKFLETDK